MEHSPPSLSVKILLSLLLGVLGTISLCGCRPGNKAEPFKHKAAASPLESPVFEFDKRLQPFANQLRNLSWSPDSLPSLFAPHLTTNSPEAPEGDGPALEWQSWRIAPNHSPQPWAALLEQFRWLEWVELIHLKGDFEDENSSEWRGELSFRCFGKKKNDHWAGLRGELKIVWRQEAGEWRVSELIFQHLEELHSPQQLFVSDLDEAVPDSITRSSLIDCPSRRAVMEFVIDPTDKEKSARVCDPYSELMNTHSGISVVDLDGDGLDDLFIPRPYNTSIFLQNIGQGRFEDRTDLHNLAYPGCTSAAFADFDNDGDPDLILGRYRLPSLYLTNEDGRFQESPDKLADQLPDSVSSISCADINGDGLLDAFLATHSYVQRTFVVKPALTPPWSNAGELLAPRHFVYPFLDPPDAETEHLKALLESNQANLHDNYPSQPSVILINQGDGVLKRAETPDWAYRLNFQGTFSDLDRDGDPDLILANEAGPAEILVNEAGRLTPQATPDRAFSSGSSTACSVADLGNDGKIDILLSRNLEPSDRRVIRSPLASLSTSPTPPPNSLFTFATGTEKQEFNPGAFLWSGQFFDLNNDGNLDLHLATGLYSAVSPRDPYLLQDTIGHPGFRRNQTNLNLRCLTSLSGSQRNLTYLSNEDGVLQDISAISGVNSPLDSRCVAVVDYDNDGWQDLVTTSLGFPALSIQKNLSKQRWPAHRSLKIRLVGGNMTPRPNPEWSNRNAVGARVEVKTSGGSMSRENFPWQGLATQNTSSLHFGLGGSMVIEQISVYWPSGKVTTLEGPLNETDLVLHEKESDKTPLPQAFETPSEQLLAEPKVTLEQLASSRSDLTLVVGWVSWSKDREKWLNSIQPLAQAFPPSKLQLRLLALAPLDTPETSNTLKGSAIDVLPSSTASTDQFLQLAQQMEERLNPPAAFLIRSDGTVLRYFSEPPTVSDIAEMLEEKRPHPEVTRRLNLPAPTPLKKLPFPQAEMDPSLFRLVVQK